MNELDKIFQSKLENHTSEYSEQSWGKIQSRLAKQKSKPRKLPWLWMSLFALVAVGTVYLWSNVEEKETIASDLANTPMVSNNTKLEGNTSDMASIASDSEASSVVSQLDFNSKIEVLEEDLTSVPIVADEDDLSIINYNQTNTREEMHSSTLNKPNIKSRVEKANLNNRTKTNIYLSTEAVNAEIGSDNRGSAEVGSDEIIDLTQIRSLENNNQKSAKDILNVKGVSLIRPLRTIGVSAYTKLHSENESNNISLSKSMMDDFRQDCPSFVTDRTGVYLDFYVSHELPFSSLKAKSEMNEPYAELRSNSEGPTYSFSAGARLTLMLPNGLGLKTGLNYSQVNEKFTHINTDSDLTKEVITITTVGGMEKRDTNFIIIPGTRDIVSTNKYRSFDIPLLLSYEWDVRDRTYMTANGGVLLNLLFKESGKILSETGDVIDLENTGDNPTIFKNNIGLSLFGSVGLHYRLTGNVDLILEPNIRVLLKSATMDSHSVEHKWITAGLITGMRYNF